MRKIPEYLIEKSNENGLLWARKCPKCDSEITHRNFSSAKTLQLLFESKSSFSFSKLLQMSPEPTQNPRKIMQRQFVMSNLVSKDDCQIGTALALLFLNH